MRKATVGVVLAVGSLCAGLALPDASGAAACSATPSSQVAPDVSGDVNSSGADIRSVQASLSGDCTLTVVLDVGTGALLGEQTSYIDLNSDGDPATGSSGADFEAFLTASSADLVAWNGSIFVPAKPLPVNPGTVGFSVRLDELSAMSGTSMTIAASTYSPDSGFDNADPLLLPITFLTTAAPTTQAIPTLSGTGTVGKTLTCHEPQFSGAPAPTTIVAWLRNGAVIPGHRESSYTLAPADGSKQIACRVKGTNSQGSAEASSESLLVLGRPKLTRRAVVRGTPRPGRVLRVSATLTGNAKMSYQWLRNGRAIAGARKKTYRVKRTDAGRMIACRIVAENAAGRVTARAAGRTIKATTSKRPPPIKVEIVPIEVVILEPSAR